MLKTFAYHSPSPEAIPNITKVREAYSQLHQTLAACCPASRELAVAHTNLETSAMWAVKSIVCNDPNSAVQLPPELPKDLPI